MTLDLSVVAAIGDQDAADALLSRQGTPELVRAVAWRAEEVRFLHSERSTGVAEAAIRAFGKIPPKLQQPSLATLIWAIYGSTLRSTARFEAAESALMIAARSVSQDDLLGRAEVARRLAYLRAEQRRPAEAKALLPVFLEWGELVGGRAFGQELVGAGAILIRSNDFLTAAKFTQRALAYLPATGDPYHLSAVFNLASCQLEIASTKADLATGLELMTEASSYIEVGTYPEMRVNWLRGKFLRRLGRLEDSLQALEMARVGIDSRADGMDQALLMLDLAELHLERGEPEAARQLALSSFPILKLLSTNSEAYRALLTLHRVAQDRALDSAGVAMVRERLGVS